MSRTRHRLPDNLNPEDDICYPLFVPNDPQWISALHRQIRTLTFDRHWERDEVNGADAISVRNRWNESTYLPFIDALFNSEPCATNDKGLGQCFRMDTTTDAFSFYPNDPFTDPQNSENPPIFTQLKWKRFGEIGLNGLPFIGDLAQSTLETISGYFPNDIVLTLDTFTALNPIERLKDFIGAFTQFPLPYVRIEIEGAGQIEVELLNFPYGCIAMIVPDLPVDENLNIDFDGVFDTIMGFIDDGISIPKGWISLDLDRQLPITLFVSQIQEFEFTEEGTHTIHVFFCPKPTIEPPFLNPLGGIREIEACGNIKVVGVTTGKIIGKDNLRDFENIRKGTVGMTTVNDICEGFVCAIEEVSGRILSGQAGNLIGGVSIGTDGSITIDSTGGNSASVNDVAVQRSLMGEYEYVESKMEEYLSRWNTYWDSVGLGANPTSETVVFTAFYSYISLQYELNSVALDNAASKVGDVMVEYNDYRVNSGLSIPTNLNGVDRVFFCKGISPTIVGEWVLNDGLAAEFLRTDILNLLSDNQIQQWRNEADLVSDDYQNTDCYKTPDQTVSYTPDDLINGNLNKLIYTEIVAVNFALVELQIWGGFQDDTGNKWDGMYSELANGTTGYYPTVLDTSGTDYNPTSQPVRKLGNPTASNPYSVIIELSTNMESIQANTQLTGTITGELFVKVIDRGSLP